MQTTFKTLKTEKITITLTYKITYSPRLYHPNESENIRFIKQSKRQMKGNTLNDEVNKEVDKFQNDPTLINAVEMT